MEEKNPWADDVTQIFATSAKISECKMAEMENDVAALRTKVEELQAENARFKATRAAFVKLYNSSRGAHNPISTGNIDWTRL